MERGVGQAHGQGFLDGVEEGLGVRESVGHEPDVEAGVGRLDRQLVRFEERSRLGPWVDELDHWLLPRHERRAYRWPWVRCCPSPTARNPPAGNDSPTSVAAVARTDAELVRSVQARGDDWQRDWAELVERFTPKLYGVARSFRLDEATASDLVQTAWLRLLDRGGQLRDPDAVGPWLAMVVRNEARKLVTRQRTVAVGDDIDVFDAVDDTDPAAGLVKTERTAALRSAFARLGDDCRQLLALLMVDPPLGYADIASAVGRPQGSIGPTRARCLARLRELLPSEVDS